MLSNYINVHRSAIIFTNNVTCKQYFNGITNLDINHSIVFKMKVRSFERIIEHTKMLCCLIIYQNCKVLSLVNEHNVQNYILGETLTNTLPNTLVFFISSTIHVMVPHALTLPIHTQQTTIY